MGGRVQDWRVGNLARYRGQGKGRFEGGDTAVVLKRID